MAQDLRISKRVQTYEYDLHGHMIGFDYSDLKEDRAAMKAYRRRPRRQRRLSKREELLKVIKVVVEPLRKKIAELEATLSPKPPKLGAFDKWLSSPESRQYAGQHVAWLPGTGAIEIAPTAEKLIEKLDGHPEEEKVSIAIVPTWRAAKA